ncbi:hypothetical protein Poli38472_002829 [Pythium oligandrum]|uniref:Uncharacterized protein n=1 Tax=Pythium oligandrum TaxID=41045 RepID=A0A8K1C5G0_PYTOL|nr:hypothetical protein Poli38472_002829 [Pythium oligandrum]|eukprot:TMW56904.1 hypothetical protein Poli38472_002829 [Pythium oligandrum]
MMHSTSSIASSRDVVNVVKPSAPDSAYDSVPVAQPVLYPNDGEISGHAYVPPGQRSDDENKGFVATTLRLIIFHTLNAALGLSGHTAITVGFALGLGLLPLCCFGIVIFRMTLYFVGFLAELDVSLYNFISPADEHVYVSIPRQANWFSLTGLRLAPNLSTVSSGAFLVALYLYLIKFAMFILSVMSLALTLAFPIAIISSDDDTQDTFFGSFWGLVLFVFVTVFLVLLGAAFMSFTAHISRAATRYFCCEKFSTYSYVAEASGPVFYTPAAVTYGATNNATTAKSDSIYV